MDNAFTLAGRLTDNPQTQGPTYPTETPCWMCGVLVLGSPTFAKRSCPRCGVTWQERLPDSEPPVVNSLRSLSLLLGAKWPFRPNADYADQFDELLDHGAHNVPCPG